MCGRYNVTDDPSVHELLQELDIDLGPLPIRYNIAPTDSVPVIHYWEGERVISDMRWWLVPNWSPGPSTKYAMFNARCENVDKSRAYQGSFKYKRGILPAHSFVEWHRSGNTKTPYLFSAVGRALAFAGLWDYWTDGTEHILSCSIVTTEAAPEFSSYHKRMPVMLDTLGAQQWLDHKSSSEDLSKLFTPSLRYPLQACAIDARYNNSRIKEEPRPLGSKVALEK